MVFKLEKTFAGAPNVERGRTVVLNVDPERKKLVYPSGSLIVIRDIENPDEAILYKGHVSKARAAAFSPKGGFVASTDETGHLRIWGVDNEELTLKREVRLITKGGRDIAWTGDGKRVMYVGKGAKSYGAAILLETGTQVGSISSHSEEALSVACRVDRPFRVVTTAEDLKTVLYKGPPYKFEKSMDGHTQYVNQVRYSPDGSVFITVSSDKTIRVWDGKDGTPLREMNGHKGTIYSLAFSPDGKKIVTTSADKTAKTWNVETGEMIQSFAFESNIGNMQLGAQWVESGPVSVGLCGDINFLDENNPDKPSKILAGHFETPKSIANSGKQIFTSSKDGVIAWTADNGGVRVRGKGHDKDHVSVVGATSTDMVTVGLDGQVIFTPLDRLAFEKSDPRVTVKGEANTIVVTDKDVVYVSTNNGIYVIVNKEIVQEINLDFEPCQIAVNAAGNLIAVAGHRRLVHLYNIGDNHQISGDAIELDEHLKKVTSVSFSPDGSKLATGDKGSEINVWDVASKATSITGLIFHTSSVDNINWVDNDIFVTAGLDAKIILWKSDSKFPIQKLDEAHYLKVSAIRYLGDGKLASVGADNALKLWNVDEEKE